MRELMPSLLNTLLQVPLDRAGADEELRGDLGVRPAVGRQPRDLRLLGRQLVAGLDAALADRLAGGHQLAPRALGESLHAHGRVALVRGAQLLARLAPPALPAQPLAVQEVRARERDPDAGAAEPLDRLAVEALGLFALAHERPRARLHAERPVGPARPADLLQPPQGSGGALRHARAHGGLDELGRHPRRHAELVRIGAGLARTPRARPSSGRGC